MDNNSLSLKQQLLDMFVEYAYQEGDFILSSGQKSNFYLNGKQVTLRAQGALAVGKLIYTMLDDQTKAIAGLTLGADPIVSAVSVVSAYENNPIPALIIRKEAKGHGTKAYIEGPSLPEGSMITVLEDVVTTGKSAMLAVERLINAGYKVDKIISLVDRQAGGAEFYQSQGLQFESIFTIADIQARNREK
ncbi:orotate phosphoribosyltransferase [Cyanobacterium stanieri LEGE 03274]|uniref:Orotate phosphoribosyltransferase n=1 Tax=Cyanobacterium stanieri LEGE 03274 TaxID=1828756 RepID=A0ABR9V5S8_9CHRO|nr:orotate phosphoribosyltransferase [Cyanobacterium stanieri]MBE9222894.1 orotate phosphoribosyltransferase [Cyanobacterium stanieri LEGE 03274]